MSRVASRLRAPLSLAPAALSLESRVVSSQVAAFAVLERVPQFQQEHRPVRASLCLAPEPERSWRWSKVRWIQVRPQIRLQCASFLSPIPRFLRRQGRRRKCLRIARKSHDSSPRNRFLNSAAQVKGGSSQSRTRNANCNCSVATPPQNWCDAGRRLLGIGKNSRCGAHSPAFIMLCLPIENATKKQIDRSHNLPI